MNLTVFKEKAPGAGKPFTTTYIDGARKELAALRVKRDDAKRRCAPPVDAVADEQHEFEQLTEVYELGGGKEKRQVIHVGFTRDGLWRVLNSEGELEIIARPNHASKVVVE